MADLNVAVRNRVGILTMNRPEKLNALSAEMNKTAQETLTAWAADPNVGAIVLTGEGRGFCAGGDVSAMQKGQELGAAEMTVEQKIDRLRAGHAFPWLLYSHPKVTIAAVNGVAAGAGLGICLTCDLRVASVQARFGTAYARVGYGGDYGITWQLTRLLGPAKAKELFFLADVIDAPEALRLNLVNRVVPHDKLLEETLALAERIAAGPLVSYRYMKANVNFALTADFRTMLDRESETHIRAGETADHKEGVNAFMEKRKPVFKGR
jgi:2-(1,2-epoxy-1,2-dihydrophenyl)acetyl-CoA isomerase